MLAADEYCLRKKTALTQPRSRALAAHDVDLALENDQTSGGFVVVSMRRKTATSRSKMKNVRKLNVVDVKRN